MILGIDEAGRGPWAGPLVVGAVVLGGELIDGLTDSKKLSKRKREFLYDQIKQTASAAATGWVTASELDAIGMSGALKLATKRAVEQIHVPYHEIIIDGTVNFLVDTTKGRFVTTMAKADALVPSVSAASIIAKVERDRYMAEQDKVYPDYGFGRHAGYGVALHRAAIERLGVTPLHRLSFAPLAQYATHAGEQTGEMSRTTKTTTRRIGTQGETVAAAYLERLGHRVVERNWKTKWCEIDVVSVRDNALYFTEVKHRKNDKAGDGLAAITPRKLKQMRFAAEMYAARQPYDVLRLQVVSTTGDTPAVVDCLEIL